MKKIKRIKKHISDFFLPEKNKFLLDDPHVKEKLLKFWTPEKFSPEWKDIYHSWKPSNIYDLSIVIPVYNVQKYLRTCLDSVVKQECTYKVQVIIVNDGSTDDSYNILLDYMDIENVTVISIPNSGVAHARNIGMMQAKGKYIMFIDSDDSLFDSYVLERALDAIKESEADILQMQSVTCTDGEYGDYSEYPTGIFTSYRQFVKIPGYAFMKVFKAELFKDSFFPDGYIFEDTLMHLNIFAKCKKMIVVDDVGYVYTINPNGITGSRDGKPKSIDTVLVVPEVLLNEDYPDGYIDAILEHFSSLSYNRLKYIPEDKIKKAFLYACQIIKDIDQKPYEENRELLNVFLKRNYGLWKILSTRNTKEIC